MGKVSYKKFSTISLKEGQTVFDPCCGSGSHCFVAKSLGRKYIGVELDKDYFDVVVKRIRV